MHHAWDKFETLTDVGGGTCGWGELGVRAVSLGKKLCITRGTSLKHLQMWVAELAGERLVGRTGRAWGVVRKKPLR
jgi:hypothetical protein